MNERDSMPHVHRSGPAPGYRDQVSGQIRTWPYGTTKKVLVLDIYMLGTQRVVLCKDDNREGYALIGGDGDEDKAHAGDKGTITFTKGGSTGGYWKYSALGPDNNQAVPHSGNKDHE